MSPRLPRITGRDMLRALKRDGWYEHTQVGSHIQLKHPTKPGRVTIPIHRGETLQAFLVASILKQSGLTAEELQNLL